MVYCICQTDCNHQGTWPLQHTGEKTISKFIMQQYNVLDTLKCIHVLKQNQPTSLHSRNSPIWSFVLKLKFSRVTSAMPFLLRYYGENQFFLIQTDNNTLFLSWFLLPFQQSMSVCPKMNITGSFCF